ncbi:MAG: hypothetical protein JWQ74_3428 [Marmoricola sp.]|nr:hypothetical protein [Marmoricola sp.]
MTYEIRNVKYTTLDREATFTFSFVQIPGGAWRAYIVGQPDYGGRGNGPVQAHRLHDAGGDYVCWLPEPRTLNEAKGAARAWADATHEYIRTGRFPAPGGPRFVPDLSTSANWAFGDHSGPIPQALPAQPQINNPAPPVAQPRPAAPRETPRSQPRRPQPMQVTTSRPNGLRGLFSRRNR